MAASEIETLLAGTHLESSGRIKVLAYSTNNARDEYKFPAILYSLLSCSVSYFAAVKT